MVDKDRAAGALLGLAVGDALGTTYEFDTIDQPDYPTLASTPATDVVGGFQAWRRARLPVVRPDVVTPPRMSLPRRRP